MCQIVELTLPPKVQQQLLHAGSVIINDVFKNKYQTSLVSNSFVSQIANVLITEATTGYGFSITDTAPNSPEYNLLDNMHTNLYEFSTFKTAKFIQELQLISSLPEDEYLKLASQLNNNYNSNYMRVEAQWTQRVAAQSRRWTDIQKQVNNFPYLTFHTREDERVRLSHQSYNGITLLATHPFWRTHFPPIAGDYGCRCLATQHYNATESKLSDKILNETRQESPAVTGIPFAANHPYFKTKSSNSAKLYDIANKLKNAA